MPRKKTASLKRNIAPDLKHNSVLVHKMINKVMHDGKKRVAENHKAEFSYSDEVVKLIGSRCTEIESGGRMIDAILTNTLLLNIALVIFGWRRYADLSREVSQRRQA